jgi:hypothetical protein
MNSNLVEYELSSAAIMSWQTAHGMKGELHKLCWRIPDRGTNEQRCDPQTRHEKVKAKLISGRHETRFLHDTSATTDELMLFSDQRHHSLKPNVS